MKRVVWLLCGSLGLGCSAADPGGAGASGAPATAGSGGQSGGSNTGGASVAAGAPGSAGNSASAGAAGSALGGSPGAAGSVGAAGSANGGGGGNTGGAANAGAGGGSSCVPDAAGVLSTVGETVHDAKSCLDWMKTTKTGVNFEAAQTYCADATLGGFDDWRIPDASEFASIITLCGKYLPDGPIDTKFFDHEGDGYWTTTPAGELNKVCAVGMLNAGGYYHFGTAGPQVVRCVRGTGSVKMVKACTAADGCSNW
jgi:hypothetical protein